MYQDHINKVKLRRHVSEADELKRKYQHLKSEAQKLQTELVAVSNML